MVSFDGMTLSTKKTSMQSAGQAVSISLRQVRPLQFQFKIPQSLEMYSSS